MQAVQAALSVEPRGPRRASAASGPSKAGAPPTLPATALPGVARRRGSKARNFRTRPAHSTPYAGGVLDIDDAMNQYLLLFRGGDPVAAGFTPEQAMQQWSAWIAGLREQGAFVHGEPLQDSTGLWLHPGGRREDAVPGAPQAAVSGYLALRATDLAAAEALARACPVLGHGGSVEVRASWVMNGGAS